jgi:O-antigen/teichoic acid export membrane protein
MLRLSKSADLKSDFIWTLTGNGVYSVSQWAILMVAAKLGNASQVGEYALAVAISSPIIMLATLQARGVLMSDLQDRYSFASFLSFRIVSLVFAILVIAGIAFVIHATPTYAATILLVALGLAIEFTSDIYHGQMQKLDRMSRIARSLMIKGPISLALFAICFELTGSIAWAAAGLALGRALVLLGYESRIGDWRPGRQISELWNPSAWKQIFWAALPLGAVGALVSLNTNAPRYFIEGHFSKHDLGIYSALFSLISAGSLAIAAMGQTAFVRLAKAHQSGDTGGYFSLLYKLVGFGACLGGAAIFTAAVAGKTLLRVLFRPEYSQHSDLLVWITGLGALTYIASCLGYAMTASSCYRRQVPLFLVTLATTVGASATLIPAFGLIGAALASIVGVIVQIAGSFLVLRNWVSKPGAQLPVLVSSLAKSAS